MSPARASFQPLRRKEFLDLANKVVPVKAIVIKDRAKISP
jgi:hypothetical protein